MAWAGWPGGQAVYASVMYSAMSVMSSGRIMSCSFVVGVELVLRAPARPSAGRAPATSAPLADRHGLSPGLRLPSVDDDVAVVLEDDLVGADAVRGELGGDLLLDVLLAGHVRLLLLVGARRAPWALRPVASGVIRQRPDGAPGTSAEPAALLGAGAAEGVLLEPLHFPRLDPLLQLGRRAALLGSGRAAGRQRGSGEPVEVVGAAGLALRAGELVGGHPAAEHVFAFRCRGGGERLLRAALPRGSGEHPQPPLRGWIKGLD